MTQTHTHTYFTDLDYQLWRFPILFSRFGSFLEKAPTTHSRKNELFGVSENELFGQIAAKREQMKQIVTDSIGSG